MAETTRIVILGGGFGGVYTASALEKLIRGREHDRFEITLVSKENYITFQPMLPEVISGSVDLLHVISPIRRLAKRTRLYTREVEAIDLEQEDRPPRAGKPTAPARDPVRPPRHRARQPSRRLAHSRRPRARDPVQVPRRRAAPAQPRRAAARGGLRRGRPRRPPAAPHVRRRRRRLLGGRVHGRAAGLPARRREGVPRHRSGGDQADPPAARRPHPAGGDGDARPLRRARSSASAAWTSGSRSA